MRFSCLLLLLAGTSTLSCSSLESASPARGDAAGLRDAGAADRATGPDAVAGADGSALANALPRLPPGNHLGVFPTYESLPTATASAVDARLAEARAHGMQVSRVHVSWAELEPSATTIDTSVLERALAAATAQGQAVHLLIETVDSDGFSIPSDLAGAQYTLAAGRAFDDPLIVDRFAALLDRVLPLLATHRVFALSVGNEPDTFYDDTSPTSAAGRSWAASLLGFLAKARTRIRDALPEVAVAMTLRQGSLDDGHAAALAPLVAAGDFAAFNYYCLDKAYRLRAPGSVASDVKAMTTLAAGRPLVLQEVGCPAGRAPSVLGSSGAAQASFLAELGTVLRTAPSLRAAFAFQLVDWSPALAKTFGDAYAAEGFPALGAKVEETLASLGLLSFASGAAKPAWAEFLGTLDALTAAR
ncbi:MAG: hypothetical protein IPL40_03190 [Proteobacteria bacterium]|nr:hypothetical protein [Pseudomonadota bacterium]